MSSPELATAVAAPSESNGEPAVPLPFAPALSTYHTRVAAKEIVAVSEAEVPSVVLTS